ncbi:hypothetical protein ACIQ7D_27970 [Streptomyces sp. NPDC096310]|uniref:hypothetical protein n=1 Tax=Streptomyces sp. NPDC096310 TaxID=3366082 RepID=UPI00382B5AF5
MTSGARDGRCYPARRLQRLQPNVPVLGQELRVGMAVFDHRTDMPGLIRSFAGSVVRLVRPSGHTWEAPRLSVRPATAREQTQLRALAALHREQRPPARREG